MSICDDFTRIQYADTKYQITPKIKHLIAYTFTFQIFALLLSKIINTDKSDLMIYSHTVYEGPLMLSSETRVKPGPAARVS